jgi:hypothetical protein
MMSTVDDAALKLASTYLRANPDASLEEIAEVVSQFGGLTGPVELDDNSGEDDEDAESE